MKLYREEEIGILLDELYAFIDDIKNRKEPTRPTLPIGIEITEGEIYEILVNEIMGCDGPEKRVAAKAILSKLK